MKISDLYTVKSAYLSEDYLYRYSLTRATPHWRQDKRLLVIVGLNPSTADAKEDDNTIRRCICFAHDWGLERLVMVNLFAYRATKPAVMKDAIDPIGEDNNTYLKEVFNQVLINGGMVLTAWGLDGGFRERDTEVLAMLPPTLTPYCLGTTGAGFPRHPLYVEKGMAPLTYKKVTPVKRLGKHNLTGRRQ